MNDHDNGGPAFPLHPQADRDYGMTLRDYFAAKAMSLSFQHLRETFAGDGERFEWSDIDVEAVASDCYALADAMLKARES